jgi:hypothetical protein
MASNNVQRSNRIQFIICFFSLFISPLILHGQTPDFYNADFQIERYTRFIQRLRWTPDEYALRYEVEIDREINGIYWRHLTESTEEASIRVSLPPGNYRYRVIPYNLLNRPGAVSDWLNFEIVHALNPELESFSPSSFSIGEDLEYILHLYGNNLISEDEIYLLNYNGIVIIPGAIHILHDGKEAVLHFSRDQLSAGVFQIIVKNPGGLEGNITGFIINEERVETIHETEPDLELDLIKPYQIFMGASWLTRFYLHGDDTKSSQFLSGAALTFGLVSTSLSFFNIGVEIVPAWYPVDSLITGEELTQLFLLEINLLLQKYLFDRRAALTFRAGAGMSLPMEGIFGGLGEIPSTLDMGLVYANTGLSFLFMPSKHFYIEAGANYSFLFAIDNLSSRLRPWAGVGVRF